MAVLASIIDAVQDTAVLSRNPHSARPVLTKAAPTPPFEHLSAPDLEKQLMEAKIAKDAYAVRMINEELYKRQQLYSRRLAAIDTTPNKQPTIRRLVNHISGRVKFDPLEKLGPISDDTSEQFVKRGGRIKTVKPKIAPTRRGPRLRQVVGKTDAENVEGNVRGANLDRVPARKPVNADFDVEKPEDGPSSLGDLPVSTTAPGEVVKALFKTMNEDERAYISTMLHLTEEVEAMLKRGEKLPRGFKGRGAQLPGIPDDKLVAEKLAVNPKTIARRKAQILEKYGPLAFEKLGYK